MDKSIIDSLQNWESARQKQNSKYFKQLFTGALGFSFRLLKEDPKPSYYHVYPGVEDNRLVFYIISSNFDNEKGYQDKAVIKSNSIALQATLPIPDSEAVKRIALWQSTYEKWIDKQVRTPENIFQAFFVPADDLAFDTDVNVYFALAEDKDKPDVIEADLIISRSADSLRVDKFFDLVRPVPPFKPIDGMDQVSFYLLSSL